MQQFLLLHHHPPSIATCSATNFRLLPSPIYLPKSIGILSPAQQLFPAEAASIWGRCSSIKCMANPRRVKMVAKQIRRELSDMLLTDKVLQYAILPEAALGADRYLSSLTTISDVVVSADLQVVKVYVSVFGDERGKEVAISGLKSKAKYVRGELGRRMKLRLVPEIRFMDDESLERGSRVIAILDKIKKENEEKMGKGQGDEQFQSSDQENHDEDLDVDDINEDGIFYVK